MSPTTTDGHAHGLSPRADHVPYTEATHRALDMLVDMGLRPEHERDWDKPPTQLIHFGRGSGWLHGMVHVSGGTGRIVHLKTYWADEDGRERTGNAVDDPSVRHELESHVGQRLPRIAALARRHGLTVT